MTLHLSNAFFTPLHEVFKIYRRTAMRLYTSCCVLSVRECLVRLMHFNIIFCSTCAEITAKQLTSVQRGRVQVDMIAESGRKKEDSTHFVAISLNQPDVRERLAAFTEECLQHHGGVSHPQD